MNGGIQLRGEVAVDSMVITRTGTERVVRYAFELARQRGRTPMKVTCVDKANVFRSMAFFRSVYDEVAADYPDVERDYAYIDALSMYLVQQPAGYDVLVSREYVRGYHLGLGRWFGRWLGASSFGGHRRGRGCVPTFARHGPGHRGAGKGQSGGDDPVGGLDAALVGSAARRSGGCCGR